jgi:hypothetical protein
VCLLLLHEVIHAFLNWAQSGSKWPKCRPSKYEIYATFVHKNVFREYLHIMHIWRPHIRRHSNGGQALPFERMNLFSIVVIKHHDMNAYRDRGDKHPRTLKLGTSRSASQPVSFFASERCQILTHRTGAVEVGARRRREKSQRLYRKLNSGCPVRIPPLNRLSHLCKHNLKGSHCRHVVTFHFPKGIA